jgi:hypothetical protein
MQILNEVNAHNKDCYIGIGSLINKEQIQWPTEWQLTPILKN